MPRLSVTTKYAAQNHTVSGVFVLCKTVPAVSDTWARHATHCQRRLTVNRYARRCPQRGHMNPSGQRQVARYSWQAVSLANCRWNSRKSFGKPGRGTLVHYMSWHAETTG